MTHTEDTLDAILGTIIEVFENYNGKPLTPGDLCYRVEYEKNGVRQDCPFRGNEVFVVRDQPATNHGHF